MNKKPRQLTARELGARVLRRWLCGAVAVVVALPLAHADVAAVNELQLKSAFLYNFTKFVEWPAERFANDKDPIVIGMLADDAMHEEIASIVANRQVNGRSLVVQRIATLADMRKSHVLFVSKDEGLRYVSIRRRAELDAVLTVGDDAECRAHGGTICFTQQGDKLRFEINMDTAARLRLKISSQLQKLAIIVHKGSQGS